MEIQPGQVYADVGAIPLGRVDSFGVDWAIDAEGFDGWGATASTRRTEQKVRGHGGLSGDGYLSPRSLSLRGRAFAPTPEAARDALDRLNDAASIDDFVFTVYEPDRTRWMWAHRVDDVLHKWRMPTVFEWGLGLVADDPRKLHTELTGSTGLPSTVGGLEVPFTLPESIDAVTASGQVSLTNPGNMAGPVRIRIDGPCTGPVVTHVNSGRSLEFSTTLVLAAGEWLDIDMDAHTVLANGTANRRNYVVSDRWSAFEPGDNVWNFTAAAYHADSLMSVFATPADK